MSGNSPVTINNRTYRWMARPLVVVCVDGCKHFELPTDRMGDVIAALDARIAASLQTTWESPCYSIE